MLTTAPSHPVPPPHHHHVQHIPAHQQLAHHHSQAMQQHHQQSQSQTASQVQTHQQQAPAPPPPPQQPPQQQAAPPAHAYHPPASSGVLQPPQLTGQPTANLWVNHAAASQMYAAAFAAMSASSAAAAAEAAVTNPAPAAPRPTFVNAKQYRRILKRREARAKLDEYYQKRKAYLKEQKEKKPYMHESRHRHAMKRPRGPGGRFLTKAELEVYYAEHPDQDPNRINSSSETGSDQGSVQEPKKMKVEVQG